MQITPSQILQKTSKKVSPQEKKFQKAWKKISRLKMANTALANQLDDLIRLVSEKTDPLEQTLSLEYHALIDKKLRFLSMKSLTQWQRYELADWIEQSFDALHSFGQMDSQRFQQQVQRYNEIINPENTLDSDDATHDSESFQSSSAQQEESEALFEHMLDNFLAEQARQLGIFEQQQTSGQVDFLADDAREDFLLEQAEELSLFMQLLNDMRSQVESHAFADADADADDSHFNQEHSDQEDDKKSHKNAHQVHLKTLFSAASLKGIFRKIANALHPDKEQDPDLARHKQVLMSNALKARDEGDILTLFTMYSEHVSQDSLSFDESELEALTELLIQQATQLQDEQTQIIQQSPAHYRTYEFFYATNRKKSNEKIALYIKELEAEKASIQALTSSLSSLKMLKPFLQARYDANHNHFSRDFTEYF